MKISFAGTAGGLMKSDYIVYTWLRLTRPPLSLRKAG